MNKAKNYLTVTDALCTLCKKSLPLTGDFVKCLNYGSACHYSTCSTLSESSYSSMTMDSKKKWKCHLCRSQNKSPNTQNKSPNNLYKTMVYDDQQRKQQIDENDIEEVEDINKNNNNADEILSMSAINSNVCSLQNGMKEIKGSIEQLAQTLADTITASTNLLRGEINQALNNLTEKMTDISTQVIELKEQNEKKDTRIQTLEEKVNILEQQLINKSVEIKNVRDGTISANEVIKTIAASVDVEIQESDISNAYRIDNKDNKVIVDFCSLNKKREIMSKIRGHRINGNIFNNKQPTSIETNNTTENNKNNSVFINDQLTAHNRRLLWLAKNKAKECHWKFVWVRNGHIYAKQNENSSAIFISKDSDIELIVQN